MRSVVSVGILALASIACGDSTSESGNVYVTEQALEAVEMPGSTDAFRVIPVQLDEQDRGCSVDGLRFDQCTVVYDTNDAALLPSNLCELAVGSGSRYFVSCDAQGTLENNLEQPEEIPTHCPGGH